MNINLFFYGESPILPGQPEDFSAQQPYHVPIQEEGQGDLAVQDPTVGDLVEKKKFFDNLCFHAAKGLAEIYGGRFTVTYEED